MVVAKRGRRPRGSVPLREGFRAGRCPAFRPRRRLATWGHSGYASVPGGLAESRRGARRRRSWGPWASGTQVAGCAGPGLQVKGSPRRRLFPRRGSGWAGHGSNAKSWRRSRPGQRSVRHPDRSRGAWPALAPWSEKRNTRCPCRPPGELTRGFDLRRNLGLALWWRWRPRADSNRRSPP